MSEPKPTIPELTAELSELLVNPYTSVGVNAALTRNDGTRIESPNELEPGQSAELEEYSVQKGGFIGSGILDPTQVLSTVGTVKGVKADTDGVLKPTVATNKHILASGDHVTVNKKSMGAENLRAYQAGVAERHGLPADHQEMTTFVLRSVNLDKDGSIDTGTQTTTVARNGVKKVYTKEDDGTVSIKRIDHPGHPAYEATVSKLTGKRAETFKSLVEERTKKDISRAVDAMNASVTQHSAGSSHS